MTRVNTYMEEILKDETKISKFEETVCEVMDILEAKCPNLATSIMVKIHQIAFGDHFDDELAQLAVSEMINVDGTTGEHWSRDDTDILAVKLNVSDKADFYWAMNMMWSDFSEVLGDDANVYARLAKAYLTDPDGASGRGLMTYLWTK